MQRDIKKHNKYRLNAAFFKIKDNDTLLRMLFRILSGLNFLEKAGWLYDKCLKKSNVIIAFYCDKTISLISN